MLAFGGPEIEMDGGDMVKENVVVEVTFPDVPVMVTRDVPNETELLDERVKETNWVVVLVGLAGFGEKEAVTPVGNPEMERLMGPANPFTELTGTETAVVVPRPIATFPGF
jgi:hypothetical protein